MVTLRIKMKLRERETVSAPCFVFRNVASDEVREPDRASQLNHN
jgi:hypothetical protein